MAAKPLRLIEGDAQGSTVTLLLACRSIAYWERTLDRATDELCALEPHKRLERHCARARLFRAAEQLEFARARRDRIQAERDGERWLRTPAGRHVVLCPAESHGLNCVSCQLCAQPQRKAVVGFRAHGQWKSRIDGRLRLPVLQEAIAS